MTALPSAAPVRVGIEDLGFATASNVFPLAALAEANGVDVGKYHIGIGQEAMSVPGPDEDVVTMGAAAAAPLLAGRDLSRIRNLLFATESGVDQSKSAGVFAHALLGLGPACRVVELKQACYGATSALQMAAGIVARNPEQEVLVIASDVARYEIGSSGEPTQGAGAVALLISARPVILELEPASGLYTEDVADFWRPNYLDTALVDGPLSVSAYLRALEHAWDDYTAQGGHRFERFDHLCYHQPFTKMAVKAHARLRRHVGAPDDAEAATAQIADTLPYNRLVGNSYTASIYIGLLSLLERRDDLAGRRIGFFSYGSGCVAEFFGGVVGEGYRTALRPELTRAAIESRRPVDHATYLELMRSADYSDGGEHLVPAGAGTAPFRLTGVRAHQRLYGRSAG